ncbi:MAG: hypothetical protein AABY26_06480, partial [Nanoarchaeota archaeon]
IAMLINVSGTAGIEYLTNSWALFSPANQRALLSIAGPVIEKVGFFPAHFKEAWDIYKTTPVSGREPLGNYFSRAVKGGSKSLLEDVLVHDPFYIAFMYGGMTLSPETPAWAMATGSFLTAVFAVAGLEVGYNELSYWNYKRKLKKVGFEEENYLESRFYIDANENPENLLTQLRTEFGLGEACTLQYQDRYFKNQLASFSGRVPKLRLRYRETEKGGTLQTAQITYTRVTPLAHKNPEQFNFFPQRKDKIYLQLNEQKQLSHCGEVESESARQMLEAVQLSPEAREINFERTYAHNTELLVSTDKVATENRPFYLVELKTYTDADLLRQAMRYVMLKFPVIQTTHGKAELVGMNH